MSKHTPGPWIIDVYNPNDIVSDVYDVEICAIQPVDIGGRKMWDYGEITKANASLIAAAPDLLEAIIDCRRALELANFTGELAIVDSAIAKARGES